MILRQDRPLLQLFLPAFLLFALLLNFADIAQAEAKLTFLPAEVAEPELGKGMLWKISAINGRTSYLFGTIHVDDPDVVNLAQPVRRAFLSCNSVTLELLPDQGTILQSAQAMLFQDGNTLEKVAGKSLYQRSVDAMKDRGMPQSMVSQMKPWAVMITLSAPKSKTNKFLDFRLFEQAQQFGKKTYALESYEEQIAVFNDMPMNEQVKILRETLDSLPKMSGYFYSLKKAWLRRDLAELQAISSEQMPADDPASKRLMTRLLDDRNRRMLQRMQPRLNEGQAFIAVGALHLPGNTGLIHLLREQGYNVSAVW